MVSVGINGNVYNDINFLRPASTPWFTKFKQARAKLGGFVCRTAEWGVKPWVEWDENNENSGSFLTASMFVSARFSQVVAAFFSPSPRKTKHTASTQADRTATTVVPKKTGINRNSDMEAIFQVKDIIGNVIGQIWIRVIEDAVLGENSESFFFVAVCGLYGSKLAHVFKTHSGHSTLQLLRLRDILGQN